VCRGGAENDCQGGRVRGGVKGRDMARARVREGERRSGRRRSDAGSPQKAPARRSSSQTKTPVPARRRSPRGARHDQKTTGCNPRSLGRGVHAPFVTVTAHATRTHLGRVLNLLQTTSARQVGWREGALVDATDGSPPQEDREEKLLVNRSSSTQTPRVRRPRRAGVTSNRGRCPSAVQM